MGLRGGGLSANALCGCRYIDRLSDGPRSVRLHKRSGFLPGGVGGGGDCATPAANTDQAARPRSLHVRWHPRATHLGRFRARLGQRPTNSGRRFPPRRRRQAIADWLEAPDFGAVDLMWGRGGCLSAGGECDCSRPQDGRTRRKAAGDQTVRPAAGARRQHGRKGGGGGGGAARRQHCDADCDSKIAAPQSLRLASDRWAPPIDAQLHWL